MMRNCTLTFYHKWKNTNQVNHNNSIALVQWCNAKLVSITLVRLQGHIFRATRSHELPEVTLTNQGAPLDHSEILARRTDCG